MAKNSFSFQTVLKLNSKEFEKGINQVRKSLNGLKSTFLGVSAALGAGLGLNSIIKNMKDTAQSLSVAKAVLHNVSEEVDEAGYKWDSYASNLEYVRKLSRTYGQDLTNLIEGFGQFHAAANLVLDANGKVALSLEDQKYIYEQLTRAAAGYHMSADRTKDMMNAITQMMSKGKVAAEELRRQLGNSLPGAFGLMATAMGVTTTQLEDMMRKGQVLSADALPKFAKELEKVTKDMSFDSLQQSINRLKNSWTELVESSSVEKMYKGIIDASNGVISWMTRNMASVKGMIKGALAGLAAYFTSDFVIKIIKGTKSIRANWVADFDASLSSVNRLYKATEKLDKLLIRGGNGRPMRLTDNTDALAMYTPEQWRQAQKMANDYNQALLKLHKTNVKLGKGKLLTKQEVALIKNVEKSYNEIATTGVIVSNSSKGWARIWGTIQGYASAVWTAVKGIAIQMGAMLIIGAIVGWVTKIVEKEKERKQYAEETAKIYSNYEKDIKKIDQTDGENIIKLRQQLKILAECEQGSKEWAGAVAEINEKLGLQGDEMLTIESKYEDIEKAVNRWIERLKLVSKINRNIAHQQEAEEQAEDIRSQIKAKAAEYKSKTGYELGGFMDLKTGEYDKEQLNKGNIKRKNWIEKEVKPLINRLKELQRVADDADAAVTELTKDLYKNYGTTTTGSPVVNDDDDKDKDKNKKGLAKVVEDYTKQKKELANKLKEHAITQEQYNEEFNKLVQKYWESAAETGEMSIDKILDKMDKGKTLTKMEKWYKDLYTLAMEAALNATADAAAKAIEDALEEALKDADEKIDKEIEEWAEKTEKVATANLQSMATDKPKRGKRDNIFDYKKSKSDIFGEEADVAKDYADALDDAIKDIESKYENIADASEDVRNKLAAWKQELSIVKKEASSLEEAMKIRQIQEDIDELSKNIKDAVSGGLNNLAQSTDRVVSGMDAIKKAFDDVGPDWEEFIDGWEKLMAIINEVTNIIDMFTGIMETLNTIEDLSNTKTEAEIALQREKVRLLEQEIGYREAIRLQKAKDVKLTEEATTKDLVEAGAAKVAKKQKAGEAVAGATASGAKLAFPYNLIAIAAGVAAVVAALASMNKYAKGGIIGGSSYSGDRQVARVNAGEMILNRHQQSTLFNAINSGKLGGGNVQFKIRGTDLIGVIDNERAKRRG